MRAPKPLTRLLWTLVVLSAPGAAVWVLTVPVYPGGKGRVVASRLMQIGEMISRYKALNGGMAPESLSALCKAMPQADPGVFALPWDRPTGLYTAQLDSWSSFVYCPPSAAQMPERKPEAVILHTRKPVVIPGKGAGLGVLLGDGSARLICAPELRAFLTSHPLPGFHLSAAQEYGPVFLAASAGCCLASACALVLVGLLFRSRVPGRPAVGDR
jgi:hypothetical protein